MITSEAQPLLAGVLRDPQGYAFVREGRGWVGNDVAERYEPPRDLGRFAATADWLRGRLPPGGVAFASFTFDPSSEGSAVAIPGELRRVEPSAAADSRARLMRSRGEQIRYAGSSISETAWMEAVAAATTAIHDGAYRKVVLARDLLVWTEQPLDPIGLADRLAHRFPSCMTFVHEGLVGATPELLVRRDGDRVRSVVLAGTAAPDPVAGEALLRSAKDQEEHALARDSAVESLSPLLADLAVDDAPWLLRLDNLQHLATAITGRLRRPAHVLELVDALHPTAAVGGAPREDALPLIGRLEGMDRGRYAGPIGVVRGNGDGTFGIALRCAEVADNRARLFAGCGIVGGSLPEDELEETRLKLGAMQRALGG